MRGWRPRRPSAGLKARLFRPAAGGQALWLDWHRVAPAMACLFFAMLMLRLNSSNLWPSTRLGETAMTNQNYVFYDGDSGQVAQNRLSGVTFDWTNHSSFPSSIGFTPKTNSSN